MSDDSLLRMVAVILAFLVGTGVAAVFYERPSDPLQRADVQAALVQEGLAEYYRDADNQRHWRLKPRPQSTEKP